MSSQMDFNNFEVFLNDLERIVIGRGNRRVVLGGDYNSHSRWWGSLFTNRRGEAMESWAAALDLTLHNDGVTQTCVRPQGSLIVDLTWTTADIANSIRNWRVSSTETLSDHLFLLFELGRSTFPKVEVTKIARWNFQKIDGDLFRESVEWSCAAGPVDDTLLTSDPGEWVDFVLLATLRPLN